MSDKELYDLLCNFKTGTHLSKLSRFVKAENVPATSRCVKQIYKLIIQASKKSDGVAVSQLMALLAVILRKSSYMIIQENDLKSLKNLHVHLVAIKKNHHIHRIYHVYLELLSEIIHSKLKREHEVSSLFSPVLFDMAVNLDLIFPYDIQLEAAKILNTLLEEPDSGSLHQHLTDLPEVKDKWLSLGDSVKASGDYELQVSLMELLFRLMSPPIRHEHVDDLFSDNPEVKEAFLSVKDKDFERDCRIFLNMLNDGMEHRMVYSFKCHRINVGTTDVKIPPNQNWLDINFGSKTITIFVHLPSEDGDGEFDTLIINPTNVIKHEHTVDSKNFHLILKLNIPICNLLDSKTGGSSKTVHFVLDVRPDPLGAILGLLGQHLPESPKLNKMARVDVSEETIQICGNVTKIVSTPVSERTQRINETRQMLSEKIQEPLPQFEIEQSQPERQTLKSFVATEPIMTNIRVPRSSPAENQDQNPVGVSQIISIPDSLPVSVIPDSQKASGSAENKNWKLQSSFDYSRKIDDSEISAGEDTMKDFAKNRVVLEETQTKPIEALGGLNHAMNGHNLASATDNKEVKKIKTKKPLQIEGSKSTDTATVILVGTESKVSGEDTDETIRIQNNFDKQMMKQSHQNRSCDIKIMNVINHKKSKTGEKENATIEAQENSQSKLEQPEPIPVEDSPNLSQELEQINHDICYEAPNSPGDVYKSILKDGLKESCKEALSQNNSPAQKKLQSFKRRLMDTEENYLCSQNSQESPTPSQAKRVPAFARKREVPSLNTSSSFVISKNTSLNQRRKREKSDELVPEEVIPLPPARKSILKKKFLVKNTEVDPSTPKLGTFDFDEKSPAKSDASWMKTEKKKKRTAGFKTKKQRMQEEKAAKRKIKDELKKDQPNKKFKKRKNKDVAIASSEEDDPLERTNENAPKLELKSRSPSPPPTARTTRYSMRRSVKKINYKDPGSDEDIVSVSASEFSTTTTSTVIKPAYKPNQSKKSKQNDESSVLDESIICDRKNSKHTVQGNMNPNKRNPNKPVQMAINAIDQAFSSSQSSQESRSSEKSVPEVPLHETYEDVINTSPPISAVQDDDDVTCIPSTDKVGIPLSFKTDISTLTSMVSKDPSPIIKTNFFKLPTDEVKSIKLNLSPQVKEISPAVSGDGSGGEDFCSDVGGRNRTESSSDDFLADVFEKRILKKEAEKIEKNQRKYARRPRKLNQEKKAGQSLEDSVTKERLEKLQESFDQINKSTVLEVAVTKDSNCKLMLVKEEPSRKKDEKVWLEGSESGSSTATKDNVVVSKPYTDDRHLKTIAPMQVTKADMLVQFNEISNCMITEVDEDNSELLMDIEEYHTPLPDTVRETETASMFSKILEESRLAGAKSKVPSTLVSTPTKLAHIRDAEVANVSPFQQFLEKVGGVKSPIKNVEPARHTKQNKSRSKLFDSGFETLGQISANLSLPSLSTSNEKLSKRPRLKSPLQSSSQSFCGSPPPTQTKKTFSSQSPGKQELEEYYKMLCKTPGKVSQSAVSSCSQALSDDLALSTQDYKIAEIRLSPVNKATMPAKHSLSGCSNDDELTDNFSQSSNFVVPPYMLDTEGGMALQMLQSTVTKMREKGRNSFEKHCPGT
ncbi:hypothetical protein ACHWQZ_G007097 [Mnemiopsis leidyi]